MFALLKINKCGVSIDRDKSFVSASNKFGQMLFLSTQICVKVSNQISIFHTF